MTKLEQAVLSVLSEDCRIPTEKLSVMLGESAERIDETIRALERRGVIVKYCAITDFDEEEDDCAEALIEVKVTPQTGSGFDGIASEIAQHAEVKNLYLMSGAYDFAVIVRSGSIRGISRFISDCISTFDCVISTATHFILKKYKIEGAAIKERQRGRLSVQP